MCESPKERRVVSERGEGGFDAHAASLPK